MHIQFNFGMIWILTLNCRLYTYLSSPKEQDAASCKGIMHAYAILIPVCLVGPFSLLQYVDFSIGEDSGFIRFEGPAAADKARAFAAIADEGGLTMKGHIVILEPVSGKETTASPSWH